MTRICPSKTLSEDNAWVLAGRLSWYCHRAVPPNGAFLTEEYGEPDENGVRPRRPMGRDGICRWLLDNQDSPDGRRAVTWARNMRTPQEEMERLIRLKKVKDEDAERVGENDPYAGYKQRLVDYGEWLRKGQE